MKIRYYGHSCFCCETAQGTRVLTDPYQKVGYELPQGVRADVVTISHGHFDHAYTDGVSADTVLKDGGTYTYRDVRFETIDSFHDGAQGALRGKNLIFKFFADGISFCHLGDLGEPLSPRLVKKIGNTDVLFVPVGGTYTIDAEQARDYVAAIAPKLIVPMHFKPRDGTLDIAPVSAFVRLFPEKDVSICEKETVFTKETLERYRGKILIMERSK